MNTRRRNATLPPIHVVREWAARIGCDPRSIERELLSPGSVTGLAGQRIRTALRDMATERGTVGAASISHVGGALALAGMGPR